MVEIDYTNEVLMNHYKKQEIKKAKERLAQKKTKAEILKLADERFITADEIKEALGFEFIDTLVLKSNFTYELSPSDSFIAVDK